LINVGKGIRYDGGAGTDQLQLAQTGGPVAAFDTYSIGPDIGQGNSSIVAGSATQTVSYDNLEPVVDVVPSASLTVNATPEDNSIDYVVGSVPANGKVLIDAYESIEFSNKTTLIVNAAAGADTVNLNNTSTPTGLTSIRV